MTANGHPASIPSRAQGHERCPVCDSAAVRVFLEIPDVPVHCNVLCTTAESAIHAPRGDICLTFCETCGHTYNSAFDPVRIDYTAAYENSLHFSPRFQEYASWLASHLVERHNLRGKQIIEIGCGRGDFLTLLCNVGRNSGIGFDPSYDRQNDGSGLGEHIQIIPDFYSSRYSHNKADLICCRHVLEHMGDPREFLLGLRRAVGEAPKTVVFCEVPNVLYTLKDLGVWDIIYEHHSYFSEQSLISLFEGTGFVVHDLSATFGNQFLCLEAGPGPVGTSMDTSQQGLRPLSTLVESFGEAYRKKLEEWNLRLKELLNHHRRVVVWGAGSKGVTFLNTVQWAKHIAGIVDINPRKVGKYVVGTGHRIDSPSALMQLDPDAVIMMNANYMEEVAALLDHMNIQTQLLVA